MSRQMFFADNGLLYTPAIMELGVPVEHWRFGMISWGPEGAQGDTLAEPIYDFREWKLIRSLSPRWENDNHRARLRSGAG